MKNITHKQITLRKATAMALLLCQEETIELLRQDLLPKGNAVEFARAAGFLGAKNTQHLLPHCHPVSIEAMDMTFDILDQRSFRDLLDEAYWHRSGILVRAEASSIGRTGIEMEVLTGVSVSALELYDFLKPHDKKLEIASIRLLEKTGGKSDKRLALTSEPECAVLVCSDSLAAALPGSADISGRLVQQLLVDQGARPTYYKIVADDKLLIQAQLKEWIAAGIPYIFTCGGTGLDPRDQTVEAVKELLDKEAPGVGESMRAYGRALVPTAILSAAIAGSAGRSFLITLPGSPAGVKESLQSVMPAIFHAGLMMQGKGHK